ncbi:MAG TPA: hypothetical protein VFK02_11590 [Kofleriaceae bacterium]|nr:hypothetical protein [Kofleriaceae bacterium]
MSLRAEVLLWAQRVVARRSPTAQQILELPPGAGADAAQEAFHKIARMAHPDLHRSALTAEELELVTTAYARAAAAYQELGGPRHSTMRMRPIRPGSNPAIMTTEVIPTSPQSNKAIAVPSEPSATQPIRPVQAMTSKALLYYRKAELCLSRGELAGAVLQLKMAIASDPQSQFLRSALAEVEAEVGKKP